MGMGEELSKLPLHSEVISISVGLPHGPKEGMLRAVNKHYTGAERLSTTLPKSDVPLGLVAAQRQVIRADTIQLKVEVYDDGTKQYSVVVPEVPKKSHKKKVVEEVTE